MQSWCPPPARLRHQFVDPVLFALLFLTTALSQAAAPPNDAFADALEIPSLTNTVATAESTTEFATYEAEEPLHLDYAGQGSVWFTWVAPWNGDILFTTAGSASLGFIVVYTGTTLTELVPLTTAHSTVARVVEGQRYFVVVNASWDSPGMVRVSVHPPPTNDDFADALPLTGDTGTFQGTNLSAGSEPGEPMAWPENSASIWWYWTAPATGDFLLSTAESLGISVQSAVYLGDAIQSLIPVVEPRITSCREPWGSGGWSDMVFRVREGETYRLRFSGGDPSCGLLGTIAGSYALTRVTDIPANDDFERRVALTGMTNVVVGDNTRASVELGEPGLGQVSYASPGKTLWWAYTAPDAGTLRVTARGLPFGVFWALYQGESLSDLELLTHSCCETPIHWSVQAGETVQIQVDGANWQAGEFTLETLLYVALPNDAFAESLQLEGATFMVAGNNLAATLEPGEPLPTGDAGGRTVWYSWAAPHSGRVTIMSGSATINRAMAVYTGPDLQHLRLVVAGPDGFIFMAEAGTIYHLQVDGQEGRFGDFWVTLDLTPFEPPTNDDFAHAVVLTGLVGSGGGWIEPATLELGEPAHRDGAPCKSLWWKWQAPQNGRASFHNNNSLATNLTFAVYRGASVEALTLVGKGTNALNLEPVQGGTTYCIAAVVDEATRGDVSFAVVNGAPFSTPALIVPGNLLKEPSFEGTALQLASWGFSTSNIGGYVGERGGADGTTWIALSAGTTMWQDFATVPSWDYGIRFAFRPEFGAPSGRVRVRWNDRELGVVDAEGSHWQWPDLTTTATGEVTRLSLDILEGQMGLDAFSVVPLSAPPAIITQPSSASTFIGGTVSFLVGASGASPLAYQWFFNGMPLEGQRDKTLTLGSVSSSDAGSYSVVVSNDHGVVTSDSAMLLVETPTLPTIVLQPYGDTVVEGGYFALGVTAVGTAPLRYQWLFNGEEIPGATDRRHVLAPVQSSHAGTYTVKVWNGADTVYSLPATLIVTTEQNGGGALLFGNEIPDGGFFRRAWIYDTDEITKLAGTNYVAQLYAGPSADLIRAVGRPQPFQNGFRAGLIEPQVILLPTVASAATAFAQVRVWQSDKGSSYEEARALGGKFGKSEMLQITTGILPNPPPLWGLQSFSLRAGMPEFTVGRIELEARHSDGSVSWLLLGASGYRYAIERRTQESVWRPLVVLTNMTGIVPFTDPSATAENVNLYRARILD